MNSPLSVLLPVTCSSLFSSWVECIVECVECMHVCRSNRRKNMAKIQLRKSLDSWTWNILAQRRCNIIRWKRLEPLDDWKLSFSSPMQCFQDSIILSLLFLLFSIIFYLWRFLLLVKKNIEASIPQDFAAISTHQVEMHLDYLLHNHVPPVSLDL